MDYIISTKKQKIFFLVAILFILALFAAAFIRIDIINNTERQLTLKGEELEGLPDYSGLEVSFTKESGGWSTEVDRRVFDAYTFMPSVSNATGEEISDYRLKFIVNEDVYFITAWCGTIEFHQTNSEGIEVVQLIDLRNRPEIYLVDTVETDDDPIIPLHAGDWFVYIPSTTDGEAPLEDGGSVTPGIMYYEPKDAEGDVFTFVPSEKTDEASEADDLSISLLARASTWTKIFDLEQTDSETPDYQAYTYDLTIINNSDAVLSDYSVKLSFGTDAYIASAWNGSVTIYQDAEEDFIEDLRSFDAETLSLETINIDGEDFIHLGTEDYLVYTPNTSVTNPEVPVKPGESSVPGFIVYVKIGDTLSNAELTITYKNYKSVTSDPLFKAAAVIAIIAAILAIISIVTAFQRKHFEEIHQHDSAIIKESIQTFTGFIDAKDEYTKGHSLRVAEYTRLIAEKMGYQGEELENAYYTALLHDCGKIGIPDSILCKPGKLTVEEFEEIKKHAIRGGMILENFKSIRGVTDGAMFHHERYDGNGGYPGKKKGTDIPEIARIICVADSLDAMNTDRCYRKKLDRETIISEITTNKGKQFDPEIADIALRLIADGKIKL